MTNLIEYAARDDRSGELMDRNGKPIRPGDSMEHLDTIP